MFQSKEEITSYFIENCGEGKLDREVMGHFVDIAKHGAKLVAVDAPTPVPIGQSKIGGEPDVPENFKWPTRKALLDDDDTYILKTGPAPSFLKKKLNALRGNVEPTGEVFLPFLCQINCADVDAAGLHEHLPKTGMLYVFYDVVQQPWGDTSGVHEQESARFVRLDVDPSSLQRMASPDLLLQYFQSDQYLDVEKSATVSPLPEQALRLEAVLFPALLGDQYEKLYEDEIITEEQGDAYHDVVWNKLDQKFGRGHSLLGNPWTIQDEVLSHTEQIYCRIKSSNSERVTASDREAFIKNGCGDHIHLLQFDTDDYNGFNLADAAMIYFNIGVRDLANRNFDDAMYVVQSY